MNCSRFETLLSDYLEKVLDPRVEEAIGLHLRSCARCAELLEQVRALRQDMEAFPELEPPTYLVQEILRRTSGIPEPRSFWRDLFIPTLRPFLSQRFAFATLVMFVFLSLMVNFWGPGFSALSASDLRPSNLVEGSYRVSNAIYKNWMEIREYRARLFEEIRLLKEDLYGRLDYHLITILFKSYSESLEEQRTEPDSVDAPEPEPEEEAR